MTSSLPTSASSFSGDQNHFVVLNNGRIWRWDLPETNHHQNPTGYIQNVSSLYINITTGYIEKIIYESDNLDNNSQKDTNKTVSEYLVDKSIDFNGQLILPGLIDAHIHVAMLGESQYFLDLSSCYSIQELQLKVKEHIELYPDLDWIQGVNWDQTKLGKYIISY